MVKLSASRFGLTLGIAAALTLSLGLATPAQADEVRPGNITLTLPTQVHINGNPVFVNASGDALRKNDAVAVVIRDSKGNYEAEALDVYKSGTLQLGITTTQPGTWQANIASITKLCSYTDPQAVLANCEQDYSAGPWYETVTGFTVQPSAVTTAKFDSHISLAAHVKGRGTHRVVTWVASVRHYTRDNGWVPWKNTTVLVNGHWYGTNNYGHLIFSTTGSKVRTQKVSTIETGSIWSTTKSITK